MRSEFNKGLEYANADPSGLDDMMKSTLGNRANCCTRCTGSLMRLWAQYSPLSNTVTTMQKRYDKAISSFFVFFRFLFLVSIVFAAIYAYLIIKHFILTSDFSSTCLYNIVPCFLLYNSFSSEEQLAFVITLIVFTGLGISLTLF